MVTSGLPTRSNKLTTTLSKAKRATTPLALLKTSCLVSEVLGNAKPERAICALCKLFDTCRTPFIRPWVPKGWHGSNRRALFIGEAPGGSEDEQGRPFVGPAGKLLYRMLRSAGYEDVDVALHNANRCRPPNNQTPSMLQVRACRPFVLRTIEVLKPKLVIALGTTAARSLLNDGQATVTKLRGRRLGMPGMPEAAIEGVGNHPSASPGSDSLRDHPPLWITYHPAAILHGASHLEQRIVEDLKRPYEESLPYPLDAEPIRRKVLAVDAEWDKSGVLLCIALANRTEAITFEEEAFPPFA